MYPIADIYEKLVQETSLQNCALEFLGEKDWKLPKHTTWENPSNTYKHEGEVEPLISDHIFRKANALQTIKVKTVGFKVPILKTSCPTKTIKTEPSTECPTMNATAISLNLTACPCFPHPGTDPCPQSSKRSVNAQLDLIDQTLRSECSGQEMISLSDHEAITATIRIEKVKPGKFYQKYNILILCLQMFSHQLNCLIFFLFRIQELSANPHQNKRRAQVLFVF